jgi:hypothetical protein
VVSPNEVVAALRRDVLVLELGQVGGVEALGVLVPLLDVRVRLVACGLKGGV